MNKLATFVAVGMVMVGFKVAFAAEQDGLAAFDASDSPLSGKSSLTALPNGDDKAVDELLKICGTEEESLRIAAVQVLAEIGTPRAKAALGIVLYGNSMGTVRAAAADQLGNLGDGDSVYTLALALDSERDVEVRDVITPNLEKNLPTATDALPGVQLAKSR